MRGVAILPDESLYDESRAVWNAMIDRRPADLTPYPHRDANWVLNIQSRWREAEEDEQHISWTREAFDAVTSFSIGGVYVNFLSGDEGVDRVRAAYGESTFERLTALKNEWDPDNVLHMNQNIKPSERLKGD